MSLKETYRLLYQRATTARSLYETTRNKIPEEERPGVPPPPKLPVNLDGSEDEKVLAEKIKHLLSWIGHLDGLQDRAENMTAHSKPGTINLSVVSQPDRNETLVVRPRESRDSKTDTQKGGR